MRNDEASSRDVSATVGTEPPPGSARIIGGVRYTYCVQRRFRNVHTGVFRKPRFTSPLLLVSFFFAALPGNAALPFSGGDGFIQKNCSGCHSSSAPAARLDLTKLSYNPANPDNFAIWVKVHDRVSAGEMPPKPLPRPPAESVTQFVNGLSAALIAYEHTVTAERGRAGL